MGGQLGKQQQAPRRQALCGDRAIARLQLPCQLLSEDSFFGEQKSLCIFHVSRQAGAWEFRGKENLGLLKGGVYKYKGTVDGNSFFCTYDSTFDKGAFRMQRR